MDEDFITDITLDHLPELSDASVSFQIPIHNASVDLLADNDDFDLLCNVLADDASFAPVHFSGLPLTLGELTPRICNTSPPPLSPTLTPLPSSLAAHPLVIPPLLALERHGHIKSRQTLPSSREFSIDRLESPFVSEERWSQLRAQVATLGQADDEPSHVQTHVRHPAQDGDGKDPTLLPTSPKDDVVGGQPMSEERHLEGNDTHQCLGLSPDADVVMSIKDNSPVDTTNVIRAVPRAKLDRNPRTADKHTIAAGGASNHPVFPTTHVLKKSKIEGPSLVKEAQCILPPTLNQLTPPQSVATDSIQELAPPACMGGDTDANSESTKMTHPSTGRVAERLVSYSQKIISSIGLYKTKFQGSSPESSSHAVRMAEVYSESRTPTTPLPSPPPHCDQDFRCAGNEPLRLSEISPQKPPANVPQSDSSVFTGLQEGSQHAVSPMRPAKKRDSMDADLVPEYPRRKRSKTIPVHDNSQRRSSNEGICQAQAPQNKKADHEERVTQSETRDGTEHSNSSRFPSARTKYKPQFSFSSGCKGPTLDPFPYLSSSRQVREKISKDKVKRDEGRSKPGCLLRRSLRQHEKRHGNAVQSCRARQHSGSTSTGDLPLIEKQNATFSIPPLTKPVGFTFRVDARMEARKREERLAVSEPGKLAAVPEAKALRRSHQAALVCREGVPSAPVVPFFFCTEQRAKEREKFDAMMRRKEEEMERLKEEQRRREAEEEEQAIKELRRKAIPKANEIPEWYADMPKRKGTAM